MNISEVEAYRKEKDDKMRHGYGKNEHDRRFKSKSEMQAEKLVKDAEKQGLHMEIE